MITKRYKTNLICVALSLTLISLASCASFNSIIGHNQTNSSQPISTSSNAYPTLIPIIDAGIDKSYTSEQAIKDGYVVMRDLASGKQEVYNTNRLNRFIENVNVNRKDKVRVIKYGQTMGKEFINKLNEVEYDGNTLTDLGFDTYASSGIIGGNKAIFAKIVKTTTQNGVRYAELKEMEPSENMGATLISFSLDSVK